MIALSCGIKISVVRHLVLSQSTRVTDEQTDGRTDGQTDRITTPKTALAYARVVKIKNDGLDQCVAEPNSNSSNLEQLALKSTKCSKCRK